VAVEKAVIRDDQDVAAAVGDKSRQVA